MPEAERGERDRELQIDHQFGTGARLGTQSCRSERHGEVEKGVGSDETVIEAEAKDGTVRLSRKVHPRIGRVREGDAVFGQLGRRGQGAQNALGFEWGVKQLAVAAVVVCDRFSISS